VLRTKVDLQHCSRISATFTGLCFAVEAETQIKVWQVGVDSFVPDNSEESKEELVICVTEPVAVITTETDTITEIKSI